MKKIILLLLVVFSALFSQAQTPCVPGTILGTGKGYILPDSTTNLNHGCAGMAYEQIIYIKVPKDTTFTFLSIPINATVDSFVVDANIVGLPSALLVASVPAITPASGSTPKTNFDRLVVKGDSLACIKLSGILDAALTPGDKNLTINIRAYLSNVPAPFGPNLDTASVIGYYKITIDSPGTGACNPSANNNVFKSNITSFSLVPNPADDYLSVNINSVKADDFTLHIIDVMGKAVYRAEQKIAIGHNSIPVSTNGLADGIYLVRINNGVETVAKKLVLKH